MVQIMVTEERLKEILDKLPIDEVLILKSLEKESMIREYVRKHRNSDLANHKKEQNVIDSSNLSEYVKEAEKDNDFSIFEGRGSTWYRNVGSSNAYDVETMFEIFKAVHKRPRFKKKYDIRVYNQKSRSYEFYLKDFTSNGSSNIGQTPSKMDSIEFIVYRAYSGRPCEEYVKLLEMIVDYYKIQISVDLSISYFNDYDTSFDLSSDVIIGLLPAIKSKLTMKLSYRVFLTRADKCTYELLKCGILGQEYVDFVNNSKQWRKKEAEQEFCGLSSLIESPSNNLEEFKTWYSLMMV